MPVVIVNVADVDAVVSPLVELGSALHVLRDPGHHDAAEWAAGVRGRISGGLAERTEAWSWTTRAIRATPFVTPLPEGEFERGLDRLRELPPADVAAQLLRPVARSGDRSAAPRWARSRGAGVAELVQTLVERPEAAVAEFVDFLEQCWREWFAAEWSRVRPLETVAHAGRLEVARAIATEPRTAGEIAMLWRLDVTLVTRHLRALAGAGLARTTRRGRFVQYELDLAAVQGLGADLASLLLR